MYNIIKHPILSLNILFVKPNQVTLLDYIEWKYNQQMNYLFIFFY